MNLNMLHCKSSEMVGSTYWMLQGAHILVLSPITTNSAAGTLDNPVFDVARYRKQYPFELDSFQSISVACLVRSTGSVRCVISLGARETNSSHTRPATLSTTPACLSQVAANPSICAVIPPRQLVSLAPHALLFPVATPMTCSSPSLLQRAMHLHHRVKCPVHGA